MTKRALILTIEWIAGLLAGLCLLLGGAVWYLSQGPVSVGFLTQEIERAINTEQNQVNVAIGDTVLSWGGWDKALEILVRDVVVHQGALDTLSGSTEISANTARALARISEASVEMEVGSLLKGQFAPTQIRIHTPELYVQRNSRGEIQVLMPEKDGVDLTGLSIPSFDLSDVGIESSQGETAPTGSQNSQPMAAAFLTQLEMIETQFFALDFLRSVEMVDAVVTFDDFMAKKRWQLDQFDMRLIKGIGQTTIDMDAKVISAAHKINWSASLLHPRNSPKLDFTAEINGLDGTLVDDFSAELTPYIGHIGNINVTLDGYADLAAQETIVNFSLDSQLTQASGVAQVDLESEVVDLKLTLDQMDFEKLPNIGTALKDYNYLTGLGRVDVSTFYDAKSGMVGTTNAKLTSDALSVVYPVFIPEKLPLTAVHAEIVVSDNLTKADLMRLAFKTPEATIAGNASYHIGADEDTLSAEFQLSDFNMKHLKKYWPAGLGDDARNWVVNNIPEGAVPAADIRVKGRLDKKTNAFSFDDFGGNVHMENGRVDYLAPLPQAVEAHGHATFGLDWFDIDVKSGRAGQLIVNEGRVHITEIGTEDLISIDLSIDLPVDEALEFINKQPLQFMDKLGIEKLQATGTGHTQLKLDFPLLNDLSFEDVAVHADVNLDDVTVIDPFLQQQITSSDVKLDITHEKLKLSGQIDVADQPFFVEWLEEFHDDVDMRRSLNFNGEVATDFIEAQGVRLSPYLEGKLAVSGQLEMGVDGGISLTAKSDLAHSAILIPELNWFKPTTIPGTVDLLVSKEPEGDILINDVELKADDLAASLDVRLDGETASPKNITVESLILTDTDVAADIVWKDDGTLDVIISGDKLDMTGLQERLNFEGDEESQNKPIHLQLSVAKVLQEPDRVLNDVWMDLSHDGEEVEAVDLKANTVSGQQLNLSFGAHVPNADGVETAGRNLEFSVSDVGQLLKDLNLYEKIQGGDLLITAHRADGSEKLIGQMDVGPYKLRDAPAISVILEAISLTGLPSALSGREIDLNRFEAAFELEGDKFRLEQAKTYNVSVGLSLKGIYDLKNDNMRITGTAVPAYGLNQAIGNIPILGWIFTGGDGGGLFGATFYIQGRIGKPDVTVNPASLLTPGALRRLFDLGDGTDSGSFDPRANSDESHMERKSRLQREAKEAAAKEKAAPEE